MHSLPDVPISSSVLKLHLILCYILILSNATPSSVLAERTASIHEIQPALSDTVHAVWLNGPTHSGKIGYGNWPKFGSGAGKSVTKCTNREDALYTGYTDDGTYCEQASSALNDNAHLLIHSGRLGLVVDAGGLKPNVSSNARNLLPKIGFVPPEVSDGTPREIYDALPTNSETEITLTLTGCSSAAEDVTYTLGTNRDDAFVKVGLVRKGHAVTQVIFSGLEFQDGIDPCAGFVSEKYVPTAEDLNGGKCTEDFGDGHPCVGWNNANPDETKRVKYDRTPYTDCRGFVQYKSWGACWSVCTEMGTAPRPRRLVNKKDPEDVNCNCDSCGSWPCVGTNDANPPQSVDRTPYTECQGFVSGESWGKCYDPNTWLEIPGDLWGELSVWGDSIVFELAWNAPFGLPPGCSGTVAMSLLGGAHSASASAAAAGRVSIVLTAPTTGGSSLVAASPAPHPVEVSSPTGTVLAREATGDVFVEVPSTLPTCGYNLACANKPLTLVHVLLRNPDPADEQTLRLSFSRNFETRDSSLAQSSPGAEITGLSVQVRACVGGGVPGERRLTRGMRAQLWDAVTKQATGIPIQVWRCLRGCLQDGSRGVGVR